MSDNTKNNSDEKQKTNPEPLGPRRSKRLSLICQSTPGILESLDKWGVTKKTSLTIEHIFPVKKITITNPGGDTIIENAAIVGAGKTGVEWLVKKGFAPSYSWYVSALQLESNYEILEFIKSLGVSPHSLSNNGQKENLWHSMGSNFYAQSIAWLRKESVNWNHSNAQGKLPISQVLSHINRNLTHQDFFSQTSSLGNFLTDVVGNVPGLKDEITKEIEEAKSETKLVEALALEMIKSGVDVLQKSNGTYPWQQIDSPGSQRQRNLLRFIEKAEKAYGKPLLKKSSVFKIK